LKRASALLLLLLAVPALAGSCVTPASHAPVAPALSSSSTPVERMVEVEGAWLRARVEEPGQGAGDPDAPAIVFLHGYGSRLEGWRVVQPALAAAHRTVSFDQRGFGLSERPAGAYGPEAHARDAVAVLDALGIDRAIFVGHSYGAGVALRVALRHPERVRGLVLVSPFALERQLATSFRWAKAPLVGEYLFTTSYKDFPGEKYLLAFYEPERFVSVAALDEVTEHMQRPGSTFAALATVRGMDYASVEASYREIAVPVTVVWGEEDRVTPIRTLPAFADKLPRARFVRVPACGHMPSWEKPDAVIDAVRALAALVEVAP
jgi:pimeloyl-ACP methyl ester carboxylesterase